MRRLLRFAIRLYPKPWRERYGREFAALMKELQPSWGIVFDVFKEGCAVRLTQMNAGALLLAAALLGAAFGLMGSISSAPRVYASETRMEISPGVHGSGGRRSRSLIRTVTADAATARETERAIVEGLLETSVARALANPSAPAYSLEITSTPRLSSPRDRRYLWRPPAFGCVAGVLCGLLVLRIRRWAAV